MGFKLISLEISGYFSSFMPDIIAAFEQFKRFFAIIYELAHMEL